MHEIQVWAWRRVRAGLVRLIIALLTVSLYSCRTPPGPPAAGPPPPPDVVPPIPDPTEPPVIRGAWRPYHPRGKKKKKEPKVAATPVQQPPQAGPSHMDRHLRQQVTSWSTWHRTFLSFIWCIYNVLMIVISL